MFRGLYAAALNQDVVVEDLARVTTPGSRALDPAGDFVGIRIVETGGYPS